MKFEQVLQIYWAKGLLYNGKLEYWNTPFKSFFGDIGGFSRPLRSLMVKRFEFTTYRERNEYSFSTTPETLKRALNVFFSQFSSVNDNVRELHKSHLLKLFLIKTSRGRCHALGKPSRGQRTWSNAWTAYNYNKITRAFISEYKKKQDSEKKEVKINYKLIQKKLSRVAKQKAVGWTKRKYNFWY